MSLNAIAATALTTLQANSAGLKVVSGNVANMNTPGYARRVVNQQTLTVGGQLIGVQASDVQRVVDQFLSQESLNAGASSSRYQTQNTLYDQLNGLLGQPGDDSALTSRLNDVYSALSQAAQSPDSGAAQQGVVNALQDFATSISTVSSAVTGLQGQVDQQVASSVSTVNGLIKQIYDFNQQIQAAGATGDQSSGLLDQRDLALQSLSQYMDVRTATQPDGRTVVTTTDGVSLVGDTYAQISYAASANPGQYGPITLTNINPASGQALGTSQNLDPHLTGGSLKGMLDMRDGALSDLAQELGGFASQTAASFNALSNANASYPPPSSLNGRDTGLMSSDALNFTGKTTVAIADQNGKLVSRVDVNFAAGTLSVDGGPSTSIGSTVGSFVTALNTALGGHGGSASFTNGQLAVSASGTNGIMVQDDASTPSNRGGTGFSQFFGLNDLFKSSAPSILATGLSASSASGLAAGGTMGFVLKGPNGEIAKQASVTVTAGMTIGNVVTALNTAFGGAGTFTLAADGSMSFAPSAGNAGYQLNVTGDTTARGTTGMSFTSLFGLGIQEAAAPAQGFTVNPAVANAPQRLGFAQSTLNTGAVAGASIVTPGDARGALLLQALATAKQSFTASGGLAAQSSTLAEYAGNFYQDVATRSQNADSNYTAQSDRLQEAQSRQSSVSGVNLDEELSNMMVYQQAYAAGARILQTVQQMYDSLLQIT